MLRDGGDDWNVILGVRRIEEAIEATGPGRDFAGESEDLEGDKKVEKGCKKDL